MKRFAAAVGVLAALLVASPASATEKVCPDWTLHSITGTQWGDAAEGSTVQSASEVDLTKPAGGGTEFLATGLDLVGVVTVDYSLSENADWSAGAVRLFAYQSKTPNTLNDAPDAFVAADNMSGTLTLPDLEHVGAVGVVYDASNVSDGVVTFSDLKIDGKSVSFTDCPKATPSATPAATTPAATDPATSEPTAVAGGEATLPKTGAGVATLAGIGGAVLLAGAALVVGLRRRHRFEA